MTKLDISRMKCKVCRKWFWNDNLSLDVEDDREEIIKFHQTARFHKYAEKHLEYTGGVTTVSDNVKQHKSAQIAINFNREIVK